MHSILCSRILVCCIWLASLVSCSMAVEKGAVPVDSKVVAVTVYADRALVTRSVQVKLEAGLTQIVFPKLPGWIDEDSVRVRVRPAGHAELIDVLVEKTFLVQANKKEVRDADAAVLEIRGKLHAIADQQEVLVKKKSHVESIKVFTLDKLPKDALAKDFKIETYKNVIEFVSSSLIEIASTMRKLSEDARKLNLILDVRLRAFQEIQQRAQLEERSIFAKLNCDSIKTVQVELVYMVPGATWEPVHELRSNDGRDHVQLTSHAIITQTTGEDWLNAKLTLSTQRPSDTLYLPELESMLIGGDTNLALLQIPSQQLQ